jgi:diadenosine tetraphosphate (Ap4A) HIT family hydrolase
MLIAVDTIRPAGQLHWLIIPKRHDARDIEALNSDHLPLREHLTSKAICR